MALLMGVGFCVFAVWAYFEIGGSCLYLLGLAGAIMFVLGLARLGRKEQYPQVAEEKE